MNKCIIIGAGTYGQVYATYLSQGYHVLGFVDDDPQLIGKEVVGFQVLGNMQDLLTGTICSNSEAKVFVPIGHNEIRCNLLDKLNQYGFETPSFIHDSVILDSTITYGKAVYILPASSLMPFIKIDDYVMISMGVNIAHHVTIMKGCFFSQGSNVGASVVIDELSYIGIASTIMTGVKILGYNCLIGAGAVVIKDVPANAIMAGVPARVLKFKSK